MVDEPTTPDSIEEELPHIRSDGFSIIYTNFVQAARSPWDVTLSFGQVGEVEPGKTAVIEKANVVMTPALAKALIGTLSATVAQYEADNGEIQIPGLIKRIAEERTAKLQAATRLHVQPEAALVKSKPKR